jgi:Lipocalin-like domain
MKKLLFAALIMSALASCKKENATEIAPVETRTKSELLTLGEWKIANTEIKMDGTFQKTLYFQICESDDIFKFNADKKISVNYGSSVCNAYDPKVGTWNLMENDNKLETYIKSTQVYTISSLTANELVLITKDNSLGIFDIRITYKK